MTVSTHVLDTERGAPAAGVRGRALARRASSSGAGETDADGRIRELGAGEPGVYRVVFRPPSPFFRRVELEVELGEGHHHIPLARLLVRVRELPRQLSVERAGRALRGPHALRRAAGRSSTTRSDGRASLAAGLPEDEQLALLAAHPAIGAAGCRRARRPSRGATRRPSSPSSTGAYEERFGFRFVVFVNRRPKREIVRGAPRPRSSARASRSWRPALDELVAIAEDRWRRS